MKKNRTTLKERFKKGAIPTEADFADLIDSMLNQAEDNISKLPNDALRVTATGVDEAVVNFYRVENSEEKLAWQFKQKPDGKAGLSISDTVAPRLFIENGTGFVGVGTTTPKAKLQVLGGAIMPDSGNLDTAGILFPPDPGGGTGDKAWIRYYARTANIEHTTLELGVSNDPQDHIALMPSGAVGINTRTPGDNMKLRVEGGAISTNGNLHAERSRLAFSNTPLDPNHSIYNNGTNIDAEGAWDGMKMNVFAGLDVRVGDAAARTQKSALRLEANGNVGLGLVPNVNARLDVQGAVNIHDGNPVAVRSGYMSSGSLTIGSIAKDFGGGNNWTANTAGLLFETKANTEIAVHDSNHRVASLMYYEGDAINRITIGRDMAWGSISSLVLNGNVAVNSALGIGPGTTAPVARLDIAQEGRSGTHPTAAKGLYVTGGIGADADGVEIRHSNGTQGVGIGYNSVYATGSNANQDLGLKPRGTGRVVANGPLVVNGLLQVSGANVLVDGNRKLQFTDADVTNNLKLQLWSGYGLGINGGTLFYAADGNHSFRDANGTNERMLLTTGADGGLTVRGTGISSFAGTVNIGSLSLKGFTAADAFEWPNVTWYRDINANWDEGLIKVPSASARFARGGFGIHLHQSRQFGFYSTGLDQLMAIEGGTGNLFVKGAIASRQVYFSAYLDSNARSGNLNPLPMQTVSQNVGNGYDVNTSKFTAPVKGMYLFTMGGTRVEGTDWFHWQLMVNGQHANPGGNRGDEAGERGIVSWYYNGNANGSPISTSSRTIILALNVGDAVWVQQSGTGRCDNYRSGLEGLLISATF